MNDRQREVEVKLRVADLAALRRCLARLGARPAPGSRHQKQGTPRARRTAARLHETNVLFDTPQGGLAKHGQLLRIRVEQPADKRGRRAQNSRAILTYKGPAVHGSSADAAQGRRYKIREEIEAGVADPEQLRQILEALGLRGWFRYEKYRTSYQFPAKRRWAAGLHVEVDETPIGVFVELEGTPDAIDRAAKVLRYGPGDYITKSYLALYLDHCRKQGVQAGDMMFPPGKK